MITSSTIVNERTIQKTDIAIQNAGDDDKGAKNRKNFAKVFASEFRNVMHELEETVSFTTRFVKQGSDRPPCRVSTTVDHS